MGCGRCGAVGPGEQHSQCQCCQAQCRQSPPKALPGLPCWGSPPFPGGQGSGLTEREELVGLTCHKAEAVLAGLVLHTGLAAGVRAVHAGPALTHRVVCCVSLCLHDEASVWAEGAWAR